MIDWNLILIQHFPTPEQFAFTYGSVTMSVIVGDKFWPGIVVENKESLNNRSNNPNKSGAVTLSEIFLKDFVQFFSKNRGMSLRWPPIASEAIGDDICERLFF